MKSLKKIRVLFAFALAFSLQTSPAQSISKKANLDSLGAGIQFFSNHLSFDTLSLKNKENFYAALKSLNCISGTLFFSGNGFANTIAVQYRGSFESIQNYLDKCVAGSKITFEKCIFKTSSGSVLSVHKNFLIQ